MPLGPAIDWDSDDETFWCFECKQELSVDEAAELHWDGSGGVCFNCAAKQHEERTNGYS